jgi:hypothetical protein
MGGQTHGHANYMGSPENIERGLNAAGSYYAEALRNGTWEQFMRTWENAQIKGFGKS